MSLPDPYANEPTQEIDPDLWRLYLQAKVNAEGWEKEAARYRKKVEEQLNGAHAGIVDGKKVVYYRPATRWAVGRFIKDYPDLAQHFIHPRLEDVFSTEEFVSAHPDLAAQYQVRSFREAGE